MSTNLRDDLKIFDNVWQGSGLEILCHYRQESQAKISNYNRWGNPENIKRSYCDRIWVHMYIGRRKPSKFSE